MERIPEIFSTPQDACAAVGLVYVEGKLRAGRYVRLDDVDGCRGNGDGSGLLFSDGEGGRFGNFKRNISSLFFYDADGRKLTAKEVRQFRQRARLEKARADAEQNKVWDSVAAIAVAVMREATPATECGHPYLERKHVIPAAPLGVLDAERVNEIYRSFRPDEPSRLRNIKLNRPMRGPVLCVPLLLWGKRLMSIEFIDEYGGKWTLKDGRAKDCYWAPDGLADEVRARGRVAIAEGLATALSVSQVKGFPCVSARSCGGLMSTAMNLWRRFPTAERFVCSDIGRGSKDAKLAASMTGAEPVEPQFTEELIRRFHEITGSNDAPTDFNDYYLALGAI